MISPMVPMEIRSSMSVSGVANFCDVGHEAKIVADELCPGGFVAFLHGFDGFSLLFRGKGVRKRAAGRNIGGKKENVLEKEQYIKHGVILLYRVWREGPLDDGANRFRLVHRTPTKKAPRKIGRPQWRRMNKAMVRMGGQIGEKLPPDL